ncbi:HNH endonuclease [Nesterenkonia sp. E16_7]|nr:HNH endonuclease [Nesterenkonia sp. E16_10]MBO0598354.1 HNH endonuclease [Nesterenkonia sp. E16_7]
MPYAAPTRCYCGARATHQGRCETHQRKPWANPSSNTSTLTRYQRQQIHDQQLAREPQCRSCGATEHLEADHIVEIADGGALTDPANLQTLCTDCHTIKTRQARANRRHTRGPQ